MLTARRRSADAGQLTLLVIGYALIAGALITAGIDASKVFLAERSLSSVADAAALSAAQAVDRAAVYAGDGGGCGGLLPLDRHRAERAVAAAVADQADDLHRTFRAIDVPQTTVAGQTVSVRLGGAVAVPFGRVLALVLPRSADGRVHVAATAHAQAPVRAPGGCVTRH